MEKPIISYEDFDKVDIRIGTIIEAKINEKARKPAYIIKVDFGELGIKTSSAQLTENYNCEDLIDKQIVAVVNFEVKRIAGVKSEILILGGLSDEKGVILLKPDQKIENGSKIA